MLCSAAGEQTIQPDDSGKGESPQDFPTLHGFSRVSSHSDKSLTNTGVKCLHKEEHWAGYMKDPEVVLDQNFEAKMHLFKHPFYVFF